MKLKTILTNVLALCLTLSTLTAFADSALETTGSNVYTEDKINIVADKQHPQFTIKLKSNPTTGFSWFLRDYDSNLILPIGHRFEGPNTKLMGAPGYELWTFRVKPAGFSVPQQTTMRFVYARPWQMDGTSQVLFLVSTH